MLPERSYVDFVDGTDSAALESAPGKRLFGVGSEGDVSTRNVSLPHFAEQEICYKG
jgi:hypothetical protein